MTDVLVVGYGNDLRADDGAGRRVADAVEARDLPGVTVRSQSQLTPELALEAAGRDLVVFVDADIEAEVLTHRAVEPGEGGGVMTHHGNPASLLALVPTVGEPPRRAIVVSIPASNLGMGFELSPRTAAAVEEAIDLVERLVGTRGPGPGSPAD